VVDPAGSGPWFTKGDSASGATADYYTNATEDARVAVYDGGSVTKTEAVKSKAANALGLYDMSGNVWELCEDWYPSNSGSSRIIRGGSWYYSAFLLQVGYVYVNGPDFRNDFTGFRLARTAN
jgi:formylglycine-generating enzyme required for sulfatase activity